MKIETKAVHAGDRKKAGGHIPSTTPINLATTFLYESTADLDKVFGGDVAGESYSRYGNPTNAALEELLTELESGAGALACASGMMAVEVALKVALLDRRKHVLAASALYGATINLLTKFLEPFGVEVSFIDICDTASVTAAIEREKPGCVLMETVSNPILRAGEMDRLAAAARAVGAALVVDNTFATPLLVRPLELGAHLVVHSLTKYLAGHGDVLGGAVICDHEHLPTLRQLGKITGPVLSPFEAYLTMRGIKTFPLRMERQCRNACRVASWLSSHPRVERVYSLSDPDHPDAATVNRLFPQELRGAIVSFEVRDASRDDIFALMDRFRLIVRGTSLGDVHTLVLYPLMSSHRDLSPKQRERMGIRDNLLRLSVGIEAVDDIIEDLDAALATT
jgi:cystathionine gamma-synthase/methionine-gamma-lyase